MSDIDLSVVIPVYNEEENVQRLHARLDKVLPSLGRSYEIIFVDDGSTDASAAQLRGVQQGDPHVRVIRLRRNFGQTAAFSAGFDHARGAVVVTMDGDLQNDPADIPRLLDKIAEGYDIVSGWRVKRQDFFLTRRLPSQIANALISKMTGVPLHDYGCSLKAYRVEVVKGIRLYGEMHRFIPAIARWMGVTVAEVAVNHFPRQFGRSKYNLTRTVRVLLDLLVVVFLLNYSARPMQILGFSGLVSFSLGFLIGRYLTFEKIVYEAAIGNRPLLLLSVLLIVLGVQSLSMGFLGEMLTRIYYESQHKPIYTVREIYGEHAPR